MSPALSRPQNSDNNLPATILPYIEGTTDQIGKILCKFDIKTIFRPQTKILLFLRSPKDIIPLKSQGIYDIPCGVCDRTYIGKTNRHISTRVNEHKNMFKHRDLNSALFTHSHNTGHWIDFSHTKIIASLDKKSHRIFRAAIEIEKRPNCLNNRNDAKRLPNT